MSSGGVDAGPVDAGVVLGGACAQVGFFCFGPSTALECKVGRWVGLPCRGPRGCMTDGGATSCDMTGNLEADACASSSEGKGLCTADGGGTLECQSGVLVKTNICRTCAVSGDVVTCQP